MDLLEDFKQRFLRDELDKSIAREVFGSSLEPKGPLTLWLIPSGETLAKSLFDTNHFDDHVSDSIRGYLPYFSRNMDCAMKVVEVIRETGWCFSLCDGHPSRWGWETTFWKPDDEIQAYGDSPAEAICFAALLAVRQDARDSHE